MNKSLQMLREVLLTDMEGNSCRITALRGAESGLDHLEISVQSKQQKEEGVHTVFRVFATEEEDYQKGAGNE